MSAEKQLQRLRQAIEDFLGIAGRPILSLWEDIAEKDSGLLIGAIRELRLSADLADIESASNDCWAWLDSSLLIPRVRLSYPGASMMLAERLSTNARRLFASAMAAATARRLCSGDSNAKELLNEWLRRAGAETAEAMVAHQPDSTAEELIIACLGGLQGAVPSAIATWILWCLDENLPRVQRTRRVPYVAVTNGPGELDYVRMSLLNLPFAGLFEDPRTALVPLEDSWLEGVKRAWSLVLKGHPEYAESAIRITVSTRSRGRVLKGTSASGGIAVGLRSLLTGVPFDTSRLILASVDEPISNAFGNIARTREKLEAAARHGGIRHVALVKQEAVSSEVVNDTLSEVREFQESLPDAKFTLSSIATFDDAFSFATENVTSLRQYLRQIQTQPLGLSKRTVGIIDPYLAEVDSPPPMVVAAGGLASDSGTEGHSKRRIAYRMLLRTLFDRVGSYTLITAPPGYGKTLLACHLASHIAAETEAAFDSGQATLEDPSSKLVLLLEADAILECIGSANTSISPEAIVRKSLITAAAGTYKVGEPIFEFIIDRAQATETGGSVVIIVDALDRLNTEQRALLTPILTTLVTWPCVVLLTTRQIPVDLPRSAAVHYELLPFSAAQIQRFITQRFDDPKVAKHLIRRIRRNVRLAHSATVPQVLAWLCDVFEGVLPPSTRAALLENIIDRLCVNPPSSPDRGHEVRVILETIAYDWWFSGEGLGSVSNSTLCNWIEQVMGESLPTRVTGRLAQQLSKHSIARTWLNQFVEMDVIVPSSVDNERLGWIHDSVLEGLAAKCTAESDADRSLAATISDQRTRELLPLVAGYLKDPSGLLKDLLQGPDPFHRRLMLAAHCLSECDPLEQKANTDVASIAINILDRLVELLDSPSASDRKRASDAIWRCAAWCDETFERRLDDLLLVSPHQKTSAIAAESLVAIARDRLPPSVFRYLTEGQERIRAHAIRRLGMLADDRLPELLGSLLNDPSPDVQVAAIEALAGIGTEEAINSLMDAIKSPSRWCRTAAANALSDLGDAVSRRLWDIAINSTPEGREAAIEALGMIGSLWDCEDCPSLSVQIEQDASHLVRATYATVLGGAPKTFAEGPLLRLLADNNPKVRICALASIDRLGIVDAIEMITGMLHDPVELVRLRAAAALVHLGVDSHEQIIINRIRGGTASKEVLTMLIHGRGPDAIKILTEYLIGGSALRIPAARGLASLGARETVPQLIDLVNDSEAESARIAGIEALGVLGGPEAIAPLLSRLEDRSTLVRSAAAEALGRIGDARAASALINCLASNDSRLCLAAREALSRLGPFAQLLRTTLGNGLPKGRVALGLYEALWRGVEFADVWDFGDLTEQVSNLTYSVTYHKGKLKSNGAWINTTSYN